MPASAPSRLAVALRPGMFWLHVPAALALTGAVLLGLWQVDAWREHRRDEATDISSVEPVPLGDVMGPDDPFPADAVGLPVKITGRWAEDETWYVADRPHDGTTGFWVVSPLAVEGVPAAIPVVHGWSKATDVEAPNPPGETEVVGWLQPGESSGSTPAPARGDVLPRLRIADLLQRVDGDLYGAYVLARAGSGVAAGLEPVTPSSLPDPPTFTAVRNLLYGVQWWLFGAFAVFLWWRWTKDEITAARASDTDG